MNKTTNQNVNNNTRGQNTKRPENKDDIDSRSGEEQTFKGDDVTNNHKDKHSESSKQKNDR